MPEDAVAGLSRCIVRLGPADYPRGHGRSRLLELLVHGAQLAGLTDVPDLFEEDRPAQCPAGADDDETMDHPERHVERALVDLPGAPEVDDDRRRPGDCGAEFGDHLGSERRRIVRLRQGVEQAVPNNDDRETVAADGREMRLLHSGAPHGPNAQAQRKRWPPAPCLWTRQPRPAAMPRWAPPSHWRKTRRLHYTTDL